MPAQIDNATATRVPLYVVLSSDHITPATGKTVAVTISKNGGAFGNPSAGATNAMEIASGWYYVDLSTTDTGTNGPLIVLGTATACDNSTRDYIVATAATTAPTAAAIATAIWTDLLAGSDFSTSASIGKLLKDDVDATISSRLAPTTAGRTLDVTTGGEAGIDWANVGSPTTTVGLTGTTIATSQVVASVTSKTGYSLAAAGLDAITPVGSINVRQLLNLVMAMLPSGVLDGLPDGPAVMRDAADGTTARVTTTFDANNNRTAVTLNPPA